LSEHRTAAATRAVQQYSAERAIDDPVKLARAARIVRAALERGRLTPDDLAGGIVRSLPPAGAA
jgi:hypothetical protein